MQDFLQQTLSGRVPQERQGQNAHLSWQWLDEGILSLTPHAPTSQALVLSAGIHGNETAPVEILNLLLTPLLREKTAGGAPAGVAGESTGAA